MGSKESSEIKDVFRSLACTAAGAVIISKSVGIKRAGVWPLSYIYTEAKAFAESEALMYSLSLRRERV